MQGKTIDLVPNLASTIRTIFALREHCNPIPRTQFYVFSAAEHTSLQRCLVDTALTLDPHQHSLHADVRLCIGAVSEGASLLSTAFQPLVLSGALLDFLGKKGARRKAELQRCLERLGLPATGLVEELRSRIENEVERLKREGGRSTDPSSNMELGQLPRVVVIAREIERLLALPIPGFWDLPECSALMVSPELRAPSDEEIFLQYKKENHAQLQALLVKRNACIYAVIQSLRTHVSSAPRNLLVNEARILSAEFMDICKQEQLRKLFFMQQVCITKYLECNEPLTPLVRGSCETCRTLANTD